MLFVGLSLVLAAATATSVTWTRLDDGSGPTPRVGATISIAGDDAVVFGGCASSCCYAPLNETWVWSGKWVKGGEGPSARTGHVSFTSLSSAFVFGGLDAGEGFLSDLWEYDGKKGTWKQVDAKGLSGRAGAASIESIDGTSAFVFGGRDSERMFGDLWRFDFKNTSWHLVSDGKDNNGPEVSNAALDLVDDGEVLLVFGGTTVSGTDSSKIYAFNFTSLTWTTLSTSLPSPRHGMGSWGRGEGVVWGGAGAVGLEGPFFGDTLELSMSTNSIQTLQNSSYNPKSTTQPDARVFPATSSPPKSKHSILFFGGFSGYGGGIDDRLHNDLWMGTLAM